MVLSIVAINLCPSQLVIVIYPGRLRPEEYSDATPQFLYRGCQDGRLSCSQGKLDTSNLY